MKKTITVNDFKDVFAIIPDNANKGEMGRVLLVCGSYCGGGLSMCGAAYFAAKAAYLCGAGIVEIFTPRENYAPLASLVPEAVFSLYGYDEDPLAVTARLSESVLESDSVVIGCGFGKSDLSKEILKTVIEKVSCPLTVDADGLNILSENDEYWALLDREQRGRTVITPHPGEMSRLCGKSITDIVKKIPESAENYAAEKGIICLLKDHNTAVTDGDFVYINQSGNPGMATAGMGDVLAGIIGAVLARAKTDEKSDILRRVAASAYLHGVAGDIAADRLGQYSVTAGEILAEIPTAIRRVFG